MNQMISQKILILEKLLHVLMDNVATGLTVRFNAAKIEAPKIILGRRYPTVCECELE